MYKKDFIDTNDFTRQELLDIIELSLAIKRAIAQGLSAAVYTQLSDVEHELNGLVTYDRSIVKLPVQTLRKIFYIENE